MTGGCIGDGDGEGELQKPRRVMTHKGCSQKKTKKHPEQIRKTKTSSQRKVKISHNCTDNFISPDRPPLHTVDVALEGTLKAGFLKEVAESSGAQDPLIILSWDQNEGACLGS